MRSITDPEKGAEIAVEVCSPGLGSKAQPKAVDSAQAPGSLGVPPIPSESFLSLRTFIILVSFLHGLAAIKGLAEFSYQKDTLLLSPTAIQLISGLAFFPWCIKPVFGFLCDKLAARLQRIGPIILVASLVRLACYLTIAFLPVTAPVATLIFLVLSLAGLAENISCECTLVKMSREENQRNPDKKANYLPIFFGFRSLGGFFGALASGRMVRVYSIRAAFLTAAFFALLVAIICLLLRERRAETPPAPRSLRQEVQVIRDMLFGDQVVTMAAFVFVLNLAPSFDQVSSYYLTEEFQFTEVDLSDLQAFSVLCYVVGLAWYSHSLYQLNARRFYVITNVLYWFVNCSFFLMVLGYTEAWGLDPKIFCYFNFGFSSLIGELNFMPIIAIWCALCPPNLEATSITLITGLMNLSYDLSTYIGAGLTYLLDIRQKHFEDFWILITIQNWFLLLAIIAIFVIGLPDPTEPESGVTSTVGPSTGDPKKALVD